MQNAIRTRVLKLVLFFRFLQTRMQSLRPIPEARYTGIAGALNEMVHKEGVFRPLRGMPAVVFGAGPAHALYFSCYEYLKRLFSSSSLASHTNHFGHGKVYATFRKNYSD